MNFMVFYSIQGDFFSRCIVSFVQACHTENNKHMFSPPYLHFVGISVVSFWHGLLMAYSFIIK